MAQQLEVCKRYFDGTLIDGYNGNVHRVVFRQLLEQAIEYDHSDRTKSDIIISLMMALLLCFGVIENAEKQSAKPKHLLPQYKLKMPA